MPCEKRSTKKYTTRNSPPYPANECKNLTRKGNDGTFYESRPNKNNVYRWYKKTGSKTSNKKSTCQKRNTRVVDSYVIE